MLTEALLRRSATPHAQPDPESGDLFTRHLTTIESVIRTVACRHHLAPDQAEEFAALVRLRLIQNGCEVLRKFQGRSSLRTFLAVVVERLFLDARTAEWGKWRPSAEARRLGPIAIQLEMLISRDGLSFEQACDTLRINHRVTQSRDELETILASLPFRPRRRVVGEEEVEGLTADALGPEERLLRSEARRAFAALRRAIATLAPEERAVIRLRFVEQRRIADIARLRGLEQRALYRGLDRVLHRLRRLLQHEGIDQGDVTPWLGRLDLESSRPSVLQSSREL
jgi:RNA polymerase sigma factor (sigma-70 family)